jgi:16S rRNA (guanine966-N2)-methyltransferase
MRVVAGVARGRPLRAPAGRATRPTSDRVREAIFSMITSMQDLEGSVVLDLFAGSGALGIEALSRRAASVTLVDSDRAAIDAIRANLEVLGDLRDRAKVVRSDAGRYAAGAGPFDIVLADPPYEFAEWGPLLTTLRPITGLLVAETGGPWDPGPAWETVKVKKYGGTVVSMARPSLLGQGSWRQEGET